MVEQVKNRDYWKSRFAKLEEEDYKKSEKYIKDIEEQFRIAQNNITIDIERWYRRLADNNDISLMAARQLLKRDELEEFHWSVEQYIEKGEENTLNEYWMKQLENASAKVHISKLEAMKLQIQQHTELLYTKYHNGITDYLHTSYTDRFYRTAYEIQKGTSVGSNLAELDTRKIDKVLTTPWATDGKNFSDRIWSNKDKMIKELHRELSQSIIRGEDPQKAIDSLSKTLKASKKNVGRLIMTEMAAVSSAAQKDCFKELDVEQFEVVATLDSHTSEICQNMDGKHFPMSQYEIGVTAPPLHVRCRSVTVPYFEDDYGLVGERAARDEDGNTYYVPANMTYPEWKKTFVNSESNMALTKDNNSSKMNVERDTMSLEYQRYGRNKETLINNTYINSGEYRNKFDKITENINVNRVLYSKAKEMLQHRSGTKIEDMYWIDSDTGEVVASALNEQQESAIKYSNTIKKAIKGKTNLIAMHTHPSSMPPSGADFNSMLKHGYNISLIICHNGKIFQYVAKESIDERLYSRYIQRYVSDGCSEYEAQWKSLEKLKENNDIDFWEVLS